MAPKYKELLAHARYGGKAVKKGLLPAKNARVKMKKRSKLPYLRPISAILSNHVKIYFDYIILCFPDVHACWCWHPLGFLDLWKRSS